jgi:hypothetical protein
LAVQRRARTDVWISLRQLVHEVIVTGANKLCGKCIKIPKERDAEYGILRAMVNQKMSGKNLIHVVTLLSLGVFASSALTANGLIGSPAPYFRVRSGEDRVLTLDMIKGKVTAIFYENKDIVDANKPLKDELNKLYHEQTDALKRSSPETADYRLFGRDLAFPWVMEKETEGTLQETWHDDIL